MLKRQIYTSLAASIVLAGCVDHTSEPPKPVNAPPIFSRIPDQTIQEGNLLTLNLNPYVSDPEGDVMLIKVTSGPGKVKNAYISSKPFEVISTHDYSYKNPIDGDVTNNMYTVELTATDDVSPLASKITFTVTQQDTNPPRLSPRKQPLSSGLEALVLGPNIGYSYEYQRYQTAIGLDQEKQPHIIYKDENWKVGVAYQFQGVWIKKDFGAFEGDYLSFHFDAQNVGHLAFSEGPGGEDLSYLQWDRGRWMGYVNINNGASVGLENDMTRDKTDKLHISHFAWSENMVSYATDKNGFWENTDNIASARWDQTSIATDNNDSPHIVYVSPSGIVSQATINSSNQWTTAGIQAGSNPVLRRDGQDNLHLIFYNGTLNHGVLQQNGSWSLNGIPNSLHDPAQKLDAEINQADNSVHIIHVRNGIHYTTNQTGAWKTFTIDNQANYQNPDLALAPNGEIHVSAIRNDNETEYIKFPPSFFTNK